MSAEVLPFDYNGQQVRTVTVEGEPWFLAADVCGVLEVGNPSQAMSRLDADEHTLISNEGRPVNVVSESGLYALVLGSRKPQARDFKRWVTHDVLPAIRKTGRYGSDVDMLAQLPSSELLAIAAEAARRAEDAARQIEADRPKVEYVDTFVAPEDLRILRNVAKSLQVQESVLRDALVAHGWVYVESTERWSSSEHRKVKYRRYSAHADKREYFRPVPNHDAPRFKGELMHTLKVTPQGGAAIARAAARWGLTAELESV